MTFHKEFEKCFDVLGTFQTDNRKDDRKIFEHCTQSSKNVLISKGYFKRFIEIFFTLHIEFEKCFDVLGTFWKNDWKVNWNIFRHCTFSLKIVTMFYGHFKRKIVTFFDIEQRVWKTLIGIIFDIAFT